MTDAVDDFEHRPEPPQSKGNRPAAPYGPKEAPYAEGEQQHIKCDESALRVGRNQASDETRGRERLPEVTHVLFDGVGRLHQDQRTEGELEARHYWRLMNQAQDQ